MAVDVFAEVEIARPRSEVAAFMFEPRNDAIWTSGVVDVEPEQAGPLRPGAAVKRISKFLGRRFGYRIVVVDADADSFVEMSATEPFEMRVRYELEDHGQARTLARIRTAGGGTGFFKVAGPLLARMVRRSIANDLESLKTYLESER